MTVQSYVDDTSEPELSSDARRILVYLVAEMRRGRFLPSDPGSFCGYKETHDALDLKQVRASWGNSLRVQGLQDLVLWIKAKGLPGITGLIGLLRCKVCDWHKPEHGMISGDIVELHHIDPISDAPDDGRTITAKEALELLAPVCPTCHRMIHARTGGGQFDVSELKQIILHDS